MPSFHILSANACDCCKTTGVATCTTLLHTRSGTATLKGHSEVGGESAPPKKYLQCDFSGTLLATVYPFAGCAGSPSVASCALSGSYIFHAADAGVTVTSAAVGVCAGTPLSVTGFQTLASIVALLCGGASFVKRWTLSLTQDAIRFVINESTAPGCVNSLGSYNPAEGPFVIDATGQTAFGNFSIEDTEANAIARATDVFGPWAPAVAGAGISSIATRGPGQYSFAYSFSEYQTTVSGEGSVRLRIHFLRRPAGTLDPLVGGIFVEEFVTLEPGVVRLFEGETPFAYGWETRFSHCEITPAEA